MYSLYCVYLFTKKSLRLNALIRDRMLKTITITITTSNVFLKKENGILFIQTMENISKELTKYTHRTYPKTNPLLYCDKVIIVPMNKYTIILKETNNLVELVLLRISSTNTHNNTIMLSITSYIGIKTPFFDKGKKKDDNIIKIIESL